jgi:hypothetical protein
MALRLRHEGMSIERNYCARSMDLWGQCTKRISIRKAHVAPAASRRDLAIRFFGDSTAGRRAFGHRKHSVKCRRTVVVVSCSPQPRIYDLVKTAPTPSALKRKTSVAESKAVRRNVKEGSP